MGRKPELTDLFAALADATRLRLLSLMNGREVCVCYFVEILGLPQPKISRHLAYLRRAGIVDARREGKWMHYRITMPSDPASRTILAATLDAASGRPQMQSDLRQLNRACCKPEAFQLQGAPAPCSVA